MDKTCAHGTAFDLLAIIGGGSGCQECKAEIAARPAHRSWVFENLKPTEKQVPDWIDYLNGSALVAKNSDLLL
jgi:hypothetical protein